MVRSHQVTLTLCVVTLVRYKKDSVGRELYFTDVLVQMEAKKMGEDYNATDPPKQVRQGAGGGREMKCVQGCTG